MAVVGAADATFEATAEVLIVGGGAAGMVAALAARDAGAEVVVLERDPLPAGSTALSSGMIPAAGTRWQRARGIEDSPGRMAEDIQRKARGEADPALVRALAEASAPTLEWLADRHGLALGLVEGFRYPGHGALRMHAPPEKTGAALIAGLRAAAERAGAEIVTEARVDTLYAAGDGRVVGVGAVRPDGSGERIGCAALVLACNGFGGNREMVRRYIPEMADALYFGHPGNRGDAVRWGEALGAAVRHMGAYQGHGSVATPHGILITWALMMEGGIQVNLRGERFSNEHRGYSEQSVAVLAQPEGVAWNVYDRRLHELGLTFEDYRTAEAAGAIRQGETVEALAEATGLPAAALAASIAETAGEGIDRFGRDFSATPPLVPPFHAVRVTGALFHTQGGLVVDAAARVRRRDGSALPNLFAAGGAACGVSGPAVWGYLSGNGLLSAVVLGRLAGTTAAGQVARTGRR